MIKVSELPKFILLVRIISKNSQQRYVILKLIKDKTKKLFKTTTWFNYKISTDANT